MTYERNYTDPEQAKEAARQTGGRITAFISTDENGEPITVYCVKYKQLF